MPFRKVGENKFISESGRIFTEKQVKLYEATKFDKRRLAEYRLGKAMKALNA